MPITRVWDIFMTSNVIRKIFLHPSVHHFISDTIIQNASLKWPRPIMCRVRS